MSNKVIFVGTNGYNFNIAFRGTQLNLQPLELGHRGLNVPQSPSHPKPTSREPCIGPLSGKLLTDNAKANSERLKEQSSPRGQLPKEKVLSNSRENSLYWFCFSVQWVEFGPCRSAKVPARGASNDCPTQRASLGTWCSLSQIRL